MWDLPLEKVAVSEHGMPESDAEWKTWEEAQHALNQHAPGGGYDGGRSEYDPSVWMMGKHAPSHEKYHNPEAEPSAAGGYHMPGITHPEDIDEDEEYEQEPAHYHVMTGHVDDHDHRNWTEHEYTMFEHPHDDYSTDNAWDYFQQDHPEFNPERNINATHEVKHVHPAEHHDSFHSNLTDERNDFENRIAPAGFERESPDALGHRAYRHETPDGVVHRLWHSPYQANGPGWQTSRHDPRYERDQQLTLWTNHPDATSRDSLGDALRQSAKNKALVDPRG